MNILFLLFTKFLFTYKSKLDIILQYYYIASNSIKRIES